MPASSGELADGGAGGPRPAVKDALARIWRACVPAGLLLPRCHHEQRPPLQVVGDLIGPHRAVRRLDRPDRDRPAIALHDHEARPSRSAHQDRIPRDELGRERIVHLDPPTPGNDPRVQPEPPAGDGVQQRRHCEHHRGTRSTGGECRRRSHHDERDAAQQRRPRDHSSERSHPPDPFVHASSIVDLCDRPAMAR